jgi:lipopolysaccharide export system permease protein
MRLHDRYLFRELFTPLALCLGGFLIVAVSVFFSREVETIQEKKLNVMEIAAYCGVNLLEFFVLILPILLLLALLYALTQHSRHNEINALRAAGISLWRLCLPYFAVGLAATGVYFALNELAVPNCDRWAQQILDRHVKKGTETKNTAQSSKSIDNALGRRQWWFVDYDPATSHMLNPTVRWSTPDSRVRLLKAESAVYTNGVWTFFNAQIFNVTEQTQFRQTNVLAMPDFDETPERIRLLLKFSDTQTLHGSVNADIPLTELWEYMRVNPGLRAENLHAFQTKFWGRLAMPWTCLVVVLMAIPFGTQSSRRNMFFGVAGSIFIGFAYFILQHVSLALGENGQLPGWLAAWLPNLLFAGAGILLIWRVR